MGRTLKEEHETGDLSVYDSLTIRVYGSAHVDSSYVKDSFNEMVNAMQWAYDADRIRGFRIKRYSSNFDPDCSSEILPQLENWREYNGYYGVGVHMMVNDCSSSSSNPGVSDDVNAWDNPSDTMAITDEGNRDSDGVQASAVHEAIHSLVLSACPYVQDDMVKERDGTGWNEHSLGKVKQNIHGLGLEYHTPMLGGDYAAKNGTCDSSGTESDDEETHQLTTCENRALELSAEHADGRHNH